MDTHYKTISSMIAMAALYFMVRVISHSFTCEASPSTAMTLIDGAFHMMLYPLLLSPDFASYGGKDVFCWLSWTGQNEHLYYIWWVTAVWLVYDYTFNKVKGEEIRK